MGNLHTRDFESLWGQLQGAGRYFSTSGWAIISLFDNMLFHYFAPKKFSARWREIWDEGGVGEGAVTVNGQTEGRFSDLVDDAHIHLPCLFVAC